MEKVLEVVFEVSDGVRCLLCRWGLHAQLGSPTSDNRIFVNLEKEPRRITHNHTNTYTSFNKILVKDVIL
jgi:hypothetical protein